MFFLLEEDSMFLNKRSLDIINIFLDLTKLDILELEKILNIKKRTILSNIEVINDFFKLYDLKGIICQENSLFIDSLEKNKIQELLFYAPLCSEERVDYLFLKLLTKNKIILNHESITLDISRRTLNYDLEKLKNSLEDRQIGLISVPQQGIYIKGNENILRESLTKYLLKYFIKKEKNHKLFSNLIDLTFNKKEISIAKTITLDLINKFNISLCPEDFYMIVSIYLVSNFRNKLNVETDEIKDTDTSYAFSHYSHCSDFYEYLSNTDFKNLNNDEIEKIIEILIHSDLRSYNNSLPNSDIINFFDHVEKHLQVTIPKDKQLLMKVSNTIRVGKFKYDNKLHDPTQKKELTKQLFHIFNAVNIALEKSSHSLYEDDLIFLTFTLLESLTYESKTLSKPKNTIIVDNSLEHTYGHLLLDYIKSTYDIKLIKIIYDYELETILEQYKIEYIITLNEFKNVNIDIPIIKLNFENVWDKIHFLEGYES